MLPQESHATAILIFRCCLPQRKGEISTVFFQNRSLYFQVSSCQSFCPPTTIRYNVGNIKCLESGIISSIHPSIHPSIHHQPLIQGRITKAAVSAGCPKLPFHWPHQPTLTGGSRRIPRPVQRYNLSTWI